jgi:hypothetical protein
VDKRVKTNAFAGRFKFLSLKDKELLKEELKKLRMQEIDKDYVIDL